MSTLRTLSTTNATPTATHIDYESDIHCSRTHAYTIDFIDTLVMNPHIKQSYVTYCE